MKNEKISCSINKLREGIKIRTGRIYIIYVSKAEKEKIEIKCIDSDDNPVKDQKYLLITPDGERKGKTDKEGLLKEENIIAGECSVQFYLNEDNDVAVSVSDEKYKTGMEYTIKFPIFKIQLQIDPNDASSLDDSIVLYSLDEEKKYKKTLTVKDDKITGDEFIDLHFTGILSGLSYTLEIDPGKEGDKYNFFEEIPF